MLQRSVRNVRSTRLEYIGNLQLRSALGDLNENATDPFLVLAHHGPQGFAPNNTGMPFSDHPHRGFETVTFIFEGSVLHSDSGGHQKAVDKGGVQWMTAGAGVIHNEQVTPEFMKRGGVLELAQLWINLPARLKGTAAKYIGVQADAIPALPLEGHGGALHLVSGSYGETHGPIDSLTEIFMSWVDLRAGAQVVLPAPRSRTVLFYVLSGAIIVSGVVAKAGDQVSFANDGDVIPLESSPGARLVYAHGTPLGESVVAHGPFVMNSQEEIAQTFEEFRSGAFGKSVSEQTKLV